MDVMYERTAAKVFYITILSNNLLERGLPFILLFNNLEKIQI